MVPRSLNEKADYLSKIIDFDNWTVKDCYFHALNSYWGPCSATCAATCAFVGVEEFWWFHIGLQFLFGPSFA